MTTADVPDEVPVADAVDQQREAVEPQLDEEAPDVPSEGVPLETPGSDWQEQSQTVDLDPNLEDV